MYPRVLGVVIVVLAVGLLAAQTNPPGQDRNSKTTQVTGHEGHHAAYDQCAKACNACQRACDACSSHCAKMVAQGKKEHLETQRTCQDCAAFCSTAAQIVSRGGPFADLICTSCAEACGRCGKACEQGNDPMMKACAEECRRCEKACQEMTQHAKAKLQKN